MSTTSSHNPMKNAVAFAGAATTGFVAKNSGRSQASLAAQAATDVIKACGLTAADIDGICGMVPSPQDMQTMLGIPRITWFDNPVMPVVNGVAVATAAVFSGLCNTVLVYHTPYRLPWNTASSLQDPFRGLGMPAGPGPGPDNVAGGVGYTAWASRYIHEFNVPREHLGLVAINDRSNAARNPGAAMQKPMTMDDYLSARMIRSPLCMLDMDLPVDGADAFIITTTERARDLALPPVLVNAVTLGMVEKNQEDQTPSLRNHGQHVVVDALRAKSDFWTDGTDIYFPYDGFTPITLNWFENTGWCGPGEAGSFLESNWDAANNRIMINGRIPVNPHGGALSEGGSQASGHIREAVHQLQGLAGERQVPGARTALITAGGYFFNAQGLTLVSD